MPLLGAGVVRHTVWSDFYPPHTTNGNTHLKAYNSEASISVQRALPKGVGYGVTMYKCNNSFTLKSILFVCSAEKNVRRVPVEFSSHFSGIAVVRF